MTGNGLKRLADYLWRSVAPGEPEGATDGELLARFAERGDRDAFAALVDRHGSLVWGVCGRILRRDHDREEAFQATFLVLARRAAAIRQRDSVRSWLYGVAVRVASRARNDAVRNVLDPDDVERAQPGLDPAEQAQQREVREAIDEAVALLPERQRQAVVLAYFEGRTHDEAARRLGCPRGTIATLLARARERLKRRLARRGLAPALGALTLIGLECTTAPAAVPDLLAASTVGAASAIRLGLAAGATTPATAGLVEGVMRSMFLANFKLPALALAVVLMAGTGVGLLWQPRADGQPPAATGGSARSTAVPASGDELERLKEQIRLADAVLQSARKRLAELEGAARTGYGSTARPSALDPNVAETSPPLIGTTPAPGGGIGIAIPGGGVVMIGGAPVDRLRRIEQLTEELRKEVEALRRESRPTTKTPGPTN